MADHQGFIKGWANLWAVRTILLCAFDHQEGSCLYREVYFINLSPPVKAGYTLLLKMSIKPQTTSTKYSFNVNLAYWGLAMFCTYLDIFFSVFSKICIFFVCLFDDRYCTLLWILSNSWSNLQTQSFFPWLSLNSWIGVLHKSGNNNVGKNHFESQAALADTGFWRRGFEIWTGKGGPLKRFVTFIFSVSGLILPLTRTDNPSFLESLFPVFQTLAH